LQGAGEAPISWEQHLSPCSLSSENLEGLAEKVGTLALRAARKNCCGATKKQTRKAKMAEALGGDSIGGQPRPPQGSQKQALQEPSTSGTQGKEKEKVSREKFTNNQRAIGGLWMGSLKRGSPPGSSTCIGPRGCRCGMPTRRNEGLVDQQYTNSESMGGL